MTFRELKINSDSFIRKISIISGTIFYEYVTQLQLYKMKHKFYEFLSMQFTSFPLEANFTR